MTWSDQKQARGPGAWRNRADYKAARLAVLRRAQGKCELKKPGICTYRATQAHHVDGVTEANLCDTSRMQAACGPCNADEGRPAADPTVHTRTRW